MTRSEAVQTEIGRLRKKIERIKALHRSGRLPIGKACDALKKATANLDLVTRTNRGLKPGEE
jgi:hypothetical protein